MLYLYYYTCVHLYMLMPCSTWPTNQPSDHRLREHVNKTRQSQHGKYIHCSCPPPPDRLTLPLCSRPRLSAPRYDCSTPYEILDSTHLAILAMETELAKISASAALFEVQIPDFKQLKMCRKEVRLAKVLTCTLILNVFVWVFLWVLFGDYVFCVSLSLAKWTI